MNWKLCGNISGPGINEEVFVFEWRDGGKL
jgi:hypothetical protein